MKRRTFIALIGSLAVWSTISFAYAQQGVRRVGVLIGAAGSDVRFRQDAERFEGALRDLGWIEGRNLHIDHRWDVGDASEIRSHTADLVALAPDVILVSGTAAVGPLLQATHTIPIVFVNLPDPVGAGYVKSLARPGGNATGFTNFEYSLSGKWIQLLKEIAPALMKIVVLRDPGLTAGTAQFK
jgi:putative ABC transport system substrate-binding protein